MFHIETKNNKTFIELKVKPANIFFKVVLLSVASFPIIMILGALILSDKIESPFGFFIAFVVFGLLSLFLFRLFLWNTYGREIYTISNTEYTSVNDYGWFKDNPKSITSITTLEVVFIDRERPNTLTDFTEDNLNNTNKKNEYAITFLVNGEVYPSVVKQTPQSLKEFSKVVPSLTKGVITE
ncbi:hypothetical protein ABS768_13715 [Flavobacterium sp. ST-75]|uniref:YcxB-like protein n=1 Tax=Flavobacterium rhizophilum TaxID=3163296 RepID=A0ABW8YEA0_9FLAO